MKRQKKKEKNELKRGKNGGGKEEMIGKQATTNGQREK